MRVDDAGLDLATLPEVISEFEARVKGKDLGLSDLLFLQKPFMGLPSVPWLMQLETVLVPILRNAWSSMSMMKKRTYSSSPENTAKGST